MKINGIAHIVLTVNRPELALRPIPGKKWPSL